jgi:ankyrin repeat protein
VPPGQVQQKDGRTALHWAARNGHLQVCRWLVRCGISPDVRTHDGTAPLHWAVWQRRLDVCRWLVNEAGADLHAQNSFGCNAIQWAAQTASDDLKMSKWLLVAGLDLTLLNRNGHSAVHKAAVKGHRRICEWLLSDEVGLGAAHLQADQDGNTPARMAAFEGFDELARYLQEESERKGVSNVSAVKPMI